MQPTKYQRNQRKTNVNLNQKPNNNNNNNDAIPIAIGPYQVLPLRVRTRLLGSPSSAHETRDCPYAQLNRIHSYTLSKNICRHYSLELLSNTKLIFFTSKKKKENQNVEKFIFRLLYILLLATVGEGDSKAPFSITTRPRCRKGRYSFPWIVLLYPWSLPYNAECEARLHQVQFFESLVRLDLGLNTGLPG